MRELLETTSTLTLATVGSQGGPWAVPLFFASSADLTLYWLSEAGVRHSVELASDSRVSAAVYPAVRDWREIRGLQLTGVADVVQEPELGAALDLYRAKFALGSEAERAIMSSQMYALRPTWLRLVDNRRGFAFKLELDLPEAAAHGTGGAARC